MNEISQSKSESNFEPQKGDAATAAVLETFLSPDQSKYDFEKMNKFQREAIQKFLEEQDDETLSPAQLNLKKRMATLEVTKNSPATSMKRERGSFRDMLAKIGSSPNRRN